MSRASILFLLWMISEGFAQGDTYVFTIDLQLGKVDAPRLVMVELNPINSGVAFYRFPHTAMCPTGRGGDFALKKANPKPAFATSEHISMICTIIDAVKIDTTLVYEVFTPRGELYYMQMIELLGEKVRVRLTTAKPTAILPERSQPGVEPIDGSGFQADGRKVEGVGDANAKGVPSPAYRRGGVTSTPAFIGGLRE